MRCQTVSRFAECVRVSLYAASQNRCETLNVNCCIGSHSKRTAEMRCIKLRNVMPSSGCPWLYVFRIFANLNCISLENYHSIIHQSFEFPFNCRKFLVAN